MIDDFFFQSFIDISDMKLDIEAVCGWMHVVNMILCIYSYCQLGLS